MYTICRQMLTIASASGAPPAPRLVTFPILIAFRQSQLRALRACSYHSDIRVDVLACNLRLPGCQDPVSTGILPHSLPEWAFRARPGLWRICLCPRVAQIAEQKFGSR